MNIPGVEASPNPHYVFLPRAVLRQPPVRHRGDAPDAGLTVFELAVAGACIMVARQAAADDLHATALSAGMAAIKAEREALTPAQMHQVTTADLKVGSNVIGAAGSAAYWRERTRGHTDTDIEVEISRRQLLSYAGMTRNARATEALVPALRRLTRVVGKLPPVLAHLDVSGRALRFVVGRDWLPPTRYAPVPWPPPTAGGGATAAALWLMLHGADVRPARQTTMRTGALVARLGLSARWSADVRHAFDSALDNCNRHARALSVPTFDLLPIDGGQRVRIVAEHAAAVATGETPAPARQDYDGPTGDEITETREAARREREWERQTAGPRRLAEKLARLRA